MRCVHGRAVIDKGILYAPDFLINAGGIINCAWERKGYDRKAALAPDREHLRHRAEHLQAQRGREYSHLPRRQPGGRAAHPRACRRSGALASEPTMLNRRYLRIKVYQSALRLLAGRRCQRGARIEKELFLSIERTFDLTVALLLLFGEVRHIAEQRIEERKKKRPARPPAIWRPAGGSLTTPC